VEHETYGCTFNNWKHRNSNKMFKGKFGAVPGKRSIDLAQPTVILGTSQIIRKVLQSELWSQSDGDRRWFKRRYREKSVTRDNNNNNNIIIIIIIINMYVDRCRNSRRQECDSKRS
jgi:hypothetical protein